MKKFATLLLCLAFPMALASAGTSPLALAEAVKAKQDWAGDLGKCPADLFAPTGPQSYDSEVRAQCEAASSQPACLAACTKGKGESCYWLGTALQKTVAESNEGSEILFQRACKLGVASGCTNRAAGMMPEPPALADAKSCPARTFERTCAANDAWGCAMHGFILSKDKTDPRNKKRALDALKAACQFGEDDPACRSANSLRKKLQP